MRVTDDLPLVPVTWTHRYASWGRPSASVRARMPSREGWMPKRSAAARTARASSYVIASVRELGQLSCELGHVRGELGSLRAVLVDDLGRRLGEEALVRELARE